MLKNFTWIALKNIDRSENRLVFLFYYIPKVDFSISNILDN